jgi:hypothetical protein
MASTSPVSASLSEAYCATVSSNPYRTSLPRHATCTSDLSTSLESRPSTLFSSPPSAPIASAASRVKPPANTESRRNNARSS